MRRSQVTKMDGYSLERPLCAAELFLPPGKPTGTFAAEMHAIVGLDVGLTGALLGRQPEALPAEFPSSQIAVAEPVMRYHRKKTRRRRRSGL